MDIVFSTTSRPTRHHHGYQSVRQSILDEARGIMRAEGVAALSLNEIARRLGMRPPSLYTYFPAKRALLDALFLDGMRMYRARLADLRAASGVNGGAVEAAIRDLMGFADEHPELYSLLFERPVPGFEPGPESLAEAQGVLEDSAEWMQEMKNAGVLRTQLDAAAARDLLIAVMQGLTSLKRANEPNAPPETGRFGSLIPAAVEMIRAAWMQRETPEEKEHQ